MEFLRGITKVQLNNYIGRPGSLPRDFIDAWERNETRFDKAKADWTEVKSPRRRQRSPPSPKQITGGRSFDKRSSRILDERSRKQEWRCYE